MNDVLSFTEIKKLLETLFFNHGRISIISSEMCTEKMANFPTKFGNSSHTYKWDSKERSVVKLEATKDNQKRGCASHILCKFQVGNAWRKLEKYLKKIMRMHEN